MKYLASVFLSAVLLVPAAAFASTTISLNGGAVTVTQNQPFSDPGFSANSTNFGDVSGQVFTTPVNTSVVGNTSEFYSYGPDLDGDTASASRSVTVDAANTGGGGLMFCSGPLAPGWTNGVAGGGCGQSFTFGQQVLFGGISAPCAFFWGCVIK